MTASKPPDKTLVGMPSDLKAILQKLDQAVADKATLIDQAPAAAPLDKSKTRMGQGASERPRSVPPPLPSQRTAAAAPARAASVPTPTMPTNVPNPASAAAPMDRTLIGMPSDLQAALQRALAEVAGSPGQAAPTRPPARAPTPQRPPPSAAGPALWTQPVRAVGVPSTPQSEAQMPVSAGRGPAHAGQPAAAPISTHAATPGYPVPPAQAPGLGQGYGSGLGYQAGLGYRPDQVPPGATAVKMLAPQAPLDWPPATRGRADSGLVPRPDGLGGARPDVDHGAQPPNAGGPAPDSAGQPEPSLQPSASPVPGRPEPSLGMPATRLAHLELGADVPNAAGAATSQAPRLALPLSNDEPRKTKKSAANPPKRWPAISLILLAVVAFGGVIVLRAPQLLPAPLSGLLGPAPAVPDELAAAEGAPPELPAAPVAGLTTDRAAATDPGKAAFTPTPARPPAAPAMTSGASAQLEKKAIEHLIANDYAAAKPLYEKLRSAEPSRSEFGVMVELLNRANAGPRP